MRTTLSTALVLTATAALAPADTVTLVSGKDNTLYEDSSGSLSNGQGVHMFTGRTATGSRRRALLQFDVAGSIPAGSTINSARLTLSMSMTIVGSQTTSLFRALADWGEGASDAAGNEGAGGPASPGDATWRHTFFSTSNWSALGGDFALVSSASISVNDVGFYSWGSTAGMVADAQGWLDAPASNYGWLIRGAELGFPTAKRFDTSENVIAERRPMLVIDYTPPASGPGAAFCFGDGTGTPCPCANTGGAGEGCAHSSGFGMTITGSGSTSIGADDLTMTAMACPPNNSGIFYSGTVAVNGSNGQVLYDGVQCAGGDVRRYQGLFQSTGSVSDTGFVAQDPSGVYFVPGVSYHFQFWSRDVSAPSPCGTNANFSPGYRVTMSP